MSIDSRPARARPGPGRRRAPAGPRCSRAPPRSPRSSGRRSSRRRRPRSGPDRAGDLVAGLVADHDRVVLLVEAAFGAAHAGGQQALAAPHGLEPRPASTTRAPAKSPASRRSRPCRPPRASSRARSPWRCSPSSTAPQRAPGGFREVITVAQPAARWRSARRPACGGHAARAHACARVGAAGHGLDLRRQAGHAGKMLGGRSCGGDRRCRGRPRPDSRTSRVRADHLGDAGGQAGRCRRSGFLR